MSKFMGTPGPWYISEKTVYALNGQGFNRFSALVQDAHTGEEELKANALLIAAAPELLEACQAFLEYHDAEGDDDMEMMLDYAAAVDLARDAIAKALGEQ